MANKSNETEFLVKESPTYDTICVRSVGNKLVLCALFVSPIKEEGWLGGARDAAGGHESQLILLASRVTH